MPSSFEQIADALIAALNDDPVTNFGVDFTAERSYAEWLIPLKVADASRLRVDIVPESYPTFTLASRGNPAAATPVRGCVRREVKSRIVMRQRLVAAESDDDGAGRFNQDVDVLAAALEEMALLLTEYTLPTYETATWVSTEIFTLAVGEHLREHSQYTGVIDVTYEVVN